jgi:flavoprotein
MRPHAFTFITAQFSRESRCCTTCGYRRRACSADALNAGRPYKSQMTRINNQLID